MQLNKIFELGISDKVNPWEARYIRYTNIISVLLTGANIVATLVLYILYGLSLKTILVASIILLFILILILSRYGFYTIGRTLLSLFLPLGIMFVSYITKSDNLETINSYSFFDTRTVLMGTLVIPIVIFSMKEKIFLFLGASIPGLLIILYNPIHTWLGIGYEQILGEPNIGYTMSGVYYSVTYLFLVSGLMIFKFTNESLFSKNIRLLENLKFSNKELKDASDTIHEQSLALMKSNEELSELVDRRTLELKKSNEELVKHNLELQQFSNTISHNLRGPVANLLGLAQLFELDKDESARSELVKHISASATSLDGVLKDLGKIIDIRNHLFQIKENVSLSGEFEKVKVLLSDKIKDANANFIINFKQDSLYCIRSYISSIMYNLVSNAIKYRDSQRQIKIEVSSTVEDKSILLRIKDNGIGIDLNKHEKKVFGMYKRFHDHVDGKGLGLFLTKQQVESIGGKISVSSTPGVGSTFTIKLPITNPELISEQKFYESDAVTIWFDAVNHISTLVWKREASSAEYRDGLTKNLEIFRTYKCYGSLADVRKLGMVGEADRAWFVKNILSEAPEIGLKKFIIVHDRNDGKDDAYFEGIRTAVEEHNIYFDHDSFTLKEAKHIIRNAITV